MYKNIFLLCFILCVCLSVTELYCRINGRYASYGETIGVGGYKSPFDPENKSWYHVMAPYSHLNIKQHEFTTRWSANNEGFKDTDCVVAKDKLRIIVMGDSYAEGIGADNDSSYPRQLGYRLRDSFPQKTEIWNCGVSASDLIYEYKLFHDKLLKYHPDMLVILANSSDIHDVIIEGGFERFQSDSTVCYRKGPWFEPIYARSFLARRITHDVLRYNWQFIPRKDVAQTEMNTIRDLSDAVDSFTQLCHERNIKLLFLFHPTEREFENTITYDILPLISYCERKHLPYMDIKDEMRIIGLTPEYTHSLYWPEDGHCKNAGYRYFTECTWRKVADILAR